MVTKKKAKQFIPNPVEDPKVLSLQQPATDIPADALAYASLRPTVQAALTLKDYNEKFGEIPIDALADGLLKQCEMASSGDLARTEAFLVAQAHTLDAIFHTLARKASKCEYLNQFEVNLRLALKAQGQCRATLETLAEIKNPMAGAYVRQANIAAGHQQINNGIEPAAGTSRARESEFEQNEQSGGGNGLPPDTGAPALTGSIDPQMETLGEIDRAKVA